MPLNIESGFSYFNSPQTEEDLDTFWVGLCASKEASIEALLQPNEALAVTNHMRSYCGHPSPGTRELPPLIRQWTGLAFTMSLLVLQARIQRDRKWSHVWRGTMTSQHLSDLPPAPVVIKLFQKSHLRDGPSIEDLWGEVDYAEWLPGA
jgi:hypothetical protein